MRHIIGFGALLLISAAAHAQMQAVPTRSSPDTIQFLTAAGFPVVAGQTTNRCGTPTRPTILPLDINGDGQKNEAIVVDRGPCYRTDGRAFSLMARPSVTAPWRLLYSHEGVLQPDGTKTGAWLNLVFTSGGARTTLRYNGTTYVSADGKGSAPAAAAAPTRPSPPGAGAPKAAAGGGYATDTWKAPYKVAAIPPADYAAIMATAGYKKVRGKWAGCGGQSVAQVADNQEGDPRIVDLNGDGRPEVIASDEGVECYGNSGFGYSVLTPRPGGGWAVILAGQGVPSLLTRRTRGWLDLENGGPGFCFGLYQWGGQQYRSAGNSYGGKPCNPRR